VVLPDGNAGCGIISVEGHIWIASHTGVVRGEGVLNVIVGWQAIQVVTLSIGCTDIHHQYLPRLEMKPLNDRTVKASYLIAQTKKRVYWKRNIEPSNSEIIISNSTNPKNSLQENGDKMYGIQGLEG